MTVKVYVIHRRYVRASYPSTIKNFNHSNTTSNLIGLLKLSEYPFGKDLDIQQGQLHQFTFLAMRGRVLLHPINVLDQEITFGQSIEFSDANISTAVISY